MTRGEVSRYVEFEFFDYEIYSADAWTTLRDVWTVF